LIIKTTQQSIRPLRQWRHGVICLSLASFLTNAGFTAETQAIDGIQRAALEFLTELHKDEKGEKEITVGRLDTRLRLNKCGKPLVAFLPPKGRSMGNITLGIRCPGPKSWQVYTSARVSITRDVLVAASQLQRGLDMTPDAVVRAQRDLGTLYHGHMDDPTKLKGMRLKRAVRTGAVISPSMLEPKPLVRRGDRVTLLVSIGSMEVSAVGEVLSEAAAGQLVRARNLRSKRLVQGHLQQDRTVRVVR
jgi:flagella basal body P-ring formation protein FlgA